jgi:hypothetical protein
MRRHVSWDSSFAAFALACVAACVSGCGSGDGSGSVLTYSLTFSVDGQGRFGALQFEAQHLGRSGGFVGREDEIDCEPLVDAILAGNAVGGRLAKFGMISLQGVPMPALLLRCRFRTRESLGPASFQIEVTDASDTNSNPIDPVPTVEITEIDID